METSVVMKTLKRQRVEEIYVKILEDIYKESNATIKLHEVRERISIQNTGSDKVILFLVNCSRQFRGNF